MQNFEHNQGELHTHQHIQDKATGDVDRCNLSTVPD